MSRTLKTVAPETTLEETNRLIKEAQIQHILVVNKSNELVGLLSDRDVKSFISPFAGSARENAQDKATLKIEVQKVMRKEFQFAIPEESIKEVIEKLLRHHIHGLPVLDQKRLVGIVTTTDLLRVFLGTL